ncbi:MAG: chlorophyll synthesis pathway protein BchC [Pseudomonadota bacterium]
MKTEAVLLRGPRALSVEEVPLQPPAPDEVVVDIRYSGISTGTERLLWSGDMPDFPGMGYPLVPGYESVGEVVEAGALAGLKPGAHVFVPGANCYGDIKGLFGGAARRLVARSDRVAPVDPGLGVDATLMALAATARHALAGLNTGLPDLIVGHGVMGRLLARLTILAGGAPPTVWDTDPSRRAGEYPYRVLAPDADRIRDYGAIYDVSGDAKILDTLIARLRKGGELVLAGFYAAPLTFAFPPAFMKEARLRVAAEWSPADLQAVRLLIEAGDLSLDGLITHRAPASEAASAYVTAFERPECLKMVLDWKGSA